MRLGFLLLSPLFLLITAQHVWAQNVRTHLSSDSVSVGDLFQYSLVLQQDGEYEKIVYPDTALFPPTLELKNQQQFRLSSFADSITYHLQFFGSEDIRIGPLPILLINDADTTTLYTNPVRLNFRSLVAESDSTLKPMKPNFEFPRPWWPWILAALVLIAFLIWWFKFRTQPEPEVKTPKVQPIPFKDPLDELERSIHTIREENDVVVTGDYKSYYSSISDAIRQYFEDLYLIPALESTTRELMQHLDSYGVDTELSSLTRRILYKADLVKFAKFTPTLDDAHATYQLAIDFIDRAKVADATRISRMKEMHDERFNVLNDEGENH